MPIKALKDFLQQNQVKYERINHSPAYTAQEIAETAEISAKIFAKTVIVRIDGELTMVVLPGHHTIPLEAIKIATHAQTVKLANEAEFQGRFPGCELGAMPPFGNLFQMKVLVDATLTQDKTIAFNAGSHTELLQMAYVDFARLVLPQVINLT